MLLGLSLVSPAEWVGFSISETGLKENVWHWSWSDTLRVVFEPRRYGAALRCTGVPTPG
jgi:hypothetical protein